MRAKLVTTLYILAFAAAVSACSPKPPADTSSASAESPAAGTSEMSGMAGMSDMSGMTMDSAAKTGTGVGTVTAVDKAAGTITIQHEAIPAVDWPAMTMAFKANPSSLLDKAKVGQKVTFGVSVKGSDAEVTSIQ
jgi:Cu/Ag efflux protein CusF